jgi:hypothetical protein
MILLERKTILQKIFSRISAGRPQSISLTGDKMIGKSVLIDQVLNPELQKRYIENPERFLFYYRDLNSGSLDHIKLVEDIYQTFPGSANIIVTEDDHIFNKFTRIIADINSSGKSIIIILDGFNLLTQNPDIPLDFFSFLRSLANAYHVAFITSTICPLQNLCARKEVEESPFFNIFTHIELKTFTEDEAREFLSVNNCRVDFTTMKSLTGLHPYLMNQAVELTAQKGDLSVSGDVKNILAERNASFIKDLIASYPVTYYDLLIKTATGHKPDHKELFIANALVKKGYLSDEFRVASEIIQSVLILVSKDKKLKLSLRNLLKCLRR